MEATNRPFMFWFVAVYLVFDLVFFLVGQTASIFDYEFTVRIGLQESAQIVGEYGTRVNRAIGLADTAVVVPLILISLVGIFRKKRWALSTLAAFAGISIYWPVQCAGLLWLLPGAPNYSLEPRVEYWIIFAAHAGMGIRILGYLAVRGESLWQQTSRLNKNTERP
jgi:hypothetical protein